MTWMNLKMRILVSLRKTSFFSQKFQIQKKWPKWPFSFVIVFTLFFPFDTQQLDSLLSSHQRLEKQGQNF